MCSSPVRALIPTGFGINCEAETAHALRRAGATALPIHLNDLITEPAALASARILVLAGGFSFGDHLGAGKVLANRLWRRLGVALRRFIADGGLILGICNGFQTMVRIGLVPGGDPPAQTVALAANQHGAFYDGWVKLTVDPASPCVFTRGLATLDLPVRHGEGRLIAPPAALAEITRLHLGPLRYSDPRSGLPAESWPHNPNGSTQSLAGLCDPTGRLFGLMPHPEAFLHPENYPHWRRQPRREECDGLQIFRNAVVFAARG